MRRTRPIRKALLLCAALLVGCISGDDHGDDYASDEGALVRFEQDAVTLGEAIVPSTGTFALMNVPVGACDEYLGFGDVARFGEEEPFYLGAFDQGRLGIAVIGGDDPRTYTTFDAEGDHLVIAKVAGDSHQVGVQLTFTRVYRIVTVGFETRLIENQLGEPIVIAGRFSASSCRE